MKAWEYKIKNSAMPQVGSSKDYQDQAKELNEMGKEGWELVSVTQNLLIGRFTTFLKREVAK